MTLIVAVSAAVSPTALLKRMDMFDCVHYYKDAMLGRFYAICNCCACCCGAMNAHRNGTPMLASSGYVAQVNAELCAACGSCADSCQLAAISINDGFARIDASACMGCGVCVARCPQGAVVLERTHSRGEPLEIGAMIAASARQTGIEPGSMAPNPSESRPGGPQRAGLTIAPIPFTMAAASRSEGRREHTTDDKRHPHLAPG